MIPNHSVEADEHSHKPDKPEEACGVFGIYAPGEDVAKLTYFGLYITAPGSGIRRDCHL